jgi:hypothetical protein
VKSVGVRGRGGEGVWCEEQKRGVESVCVEPLSLWVPVSALALARLVSAAAMSSHPITR